MQADRELRSSMDSPLGVEFTGNDLVRLLAALRETRYSRFCLKEPQALPIVAASDREAVA